jgi:hypothetical protein
MGGNIAKQQNYPEDLLPHIKKGWKQIAMPFGKSKKPPPDDHILQVLNVAFGASLSTQELYSIRLRIAYCNDDELKRDVELRKRNRPIRFNKPRPFSVSEIVQLAPAVDPRQLVIGVRPTANVTKKDDTGALEIWGVIDVGQNWWEFARGEETGSLGGSPPPDCLIVSTMNPGSMVVSRAEEPIVSLEKGNLVLPIAGVFQSGPVGDYLGAMSRDFYADLCIELGRSKFDPDGDDDDYPGRFLNTFIERILLRIREDRHGGTLIIVPHEWDTKDGRLLDRLQIKYQTIDQDIWPLLVSYLSTDRRFYEDHLPAWHKKTISHGLFSKMERLEGELDDAADLIRDRVNFLASLANVDGCVVLTTRLSLLGFGAEIVAQSSALQYIKVADKPDASSARRRPITDYGTRHRSALRLCSSHEGVLAFVVSQDGAIRVAKRVGSDVILWPDIMGESVF